MMLLACNPNTWGTEGSRVQDQPGTYRKALCQKKGKREGERRGEEKRRKGRKKAARKEGGNSDKWLSGPHVSSGSLS